MEPIQLLYGTPDGSLELDKNAVQAILNQPDVRNRTIVPISVVGAFRTGKSLLLNFILQFLKQKPHADLEDWFQNELVKGFKSAGGSSRVTRGILMWPEVFPIGDNLGVVLLDTQGTFDNETDMRENTLIVALSILISSLQIFNVSQQIQLDFLQNLQYFVEFGRHVASECNTKPFQKLQFLVRDWRHSEDKAFGSQGGKIYLQSWLSNETSKVNADKAKICSTLKECFEESSCFLMPYPGDTVAEGKFSGAIKEVSPKFKRYVTILMDELFAMDNLVGKKVGGSPVKVKDFLNLVATYFETLQTTNEITSSSMFESTAKIQHTLALDRAKSHYSESMSSFLVSGKSVSNFWELHESNKATVLNEFENLKLLGKATYFLDYRKQLQQEIKEIYESLEQHNAELQKKEKEAVNRVRVGEALDQYLEDYRSTMDDLSSKMDPVDDLDHVHDNLKEKLIGDFVNIAKQYIEHEEAILEFNTRLKDKIEENFPRYVEINKAKLIRLEQQLESESVEKAVKIAQREYWDMMLNLCDGPRAVSDLSNMHQQALRSALDRFDETTSAVKDDNKRQEAQQEVTTEAQRLFTTFQEANNKKRAAENAFEEEQALQDAAHRSRITLQNELGRICDNRRVVENWQHVADNTRSFALQVFTSLSSSCSDKDLIDKIQVPLLKDLDDTIHRYEEANNEKQKHEADESKSRILRDATCDSKEQYRTQMDAALDSGRFVTNLDEVHAEAKNKTLEQFINNTAEDIPSEEVEKSKLELIEYFDARFMEMESRNSRRKEFEQAEDVGRVSGAAIGQAKRVYRRDLESQCRTEALVENLAQLEQDARESAINKFYEVVASRDHSLFQTALEALNQELDDLFDNYNQGEMVKLEQKNKREKELMVSKAKRSATIKYKDIMEDALEDLNVNIENANEQALNEALRLIEQDDLESQELLKQEFSVLMKGYIKRRNAQLKEIADKQRSIVVEEATLMAETEYQQEMQSQLTRGAISDLDLIHNEVTRKIIEQLRLKLNEVEDKEANTRCLRFHHDCALRLSDWKRKNEENLKKQKEDATQQLKKLLESVISSYTSAMEEERFKSVSDCMDAKTRAQEDALQKMNSWSYEGDESKFTDLRDSHIHQLTQHIRREFKKITEKVSEDVMKQACSDATSTYNSSLRDYVSVTKPKSSDFIIWHQNQKKEINIELKRKARDCDDIIADNWIAKFNRNADKTYQEVANSVANTKQQSDILKSLFTIGGTILGLATGGVAGAAIGGTIGNQLSSTITGNQDGSSE